MIELLIVALMFGSGCAYFYCLAETDRWFQEWKKIVKSCGLRVTETSGMWPLGMKLTAKDGPLTVRIADQRYGIRLVVHVLGPPGFAVVRLRREAGRSRARGIEIGDPAFDHAFFIDGPVRLVFALLGAEVRGLLLAANAENPLEISHREIRTKMPHSQFSILLPLLVDVARRLAGHSDDAARLADNANRDPHAEVRIKNLLVLVREFPGEPGTLEALRAACSDASPEIRLRAAIELGAEGRDLLLELAEGDGDDAWSAQAVASLGRELPLERLQGLLVRSLRRRRVQTARACLELLGATRGAVAVETLLKVMARERGELAAVAALALGKVGDTAAEPPLIGALARDDAALRLAATNALGHLGSAAAVLPLKEAAECFSYDPDLGRTVRQAIAEIQSRLQGASPGQLALAGTEAGQLSLAPAEAGQLSLARTEAGQLSLATGPAGQLSLPSGEEVPE